MINFCNQKTLVTQDDIGSKYVAVQVLVFIAALKLKYLKVTDTHVIKYCILNNLLYIYT